MWQHGTLGFGDLFENGIERDGPGGIHDRHGLGHPEPPRSEELIRHSVHEDLGGGEIRAVRNQGGVIHPPLLVPHGQETGHTAG